MMVGKTESVYQNPNYFSSVGTSAVSLNTESGITEASLFDKSYLAREDGYYQKKEAYGIAETGRDAAIQTKVSNIISYIENGSEKKAINAYHELLNEMSKQERYTELKSEDGDVQLKSVAKRLIENSSGANLEELIRENTDSSFEKGFKLHFEDNPYTQEDLLKEICDLDETDMLTKPKRIAGNLCRIGVCAAAGAGIGSFVPIIGTALGGAVGAATGAISGCLF